MIMTSSNRKGLIAGGWCKSSTTNTNRRSSSGISSSSASSWLPHRPSASSCHHHRRRGAFVVLEGIDRSGKTTQCKLLWQRLLQMGLAAAPFRFPNRTTPTGRIIHEYLQQPSNDDNTTSSLNDQTIHLLFSANRWEASQEIIDTLYQGTTIVCDRYAYSGVAFSSAKVATPITTSSSSSSCVTASLSDKENADHGNGIPMTIPSDKKKVVEGEEPLNDENGNDNAATPLLSLEWCQAPDRGLPAPDCVIFLQLSPDQAEQRGGYGEERYEQRDLQIRVRQRFAELQQLDERKRQQQQQDEEQDQPQQLIPQWFVIDASQSLEQVQDEIWNAVQTTLSTLSSSSTSSEDDCEAQAQLEQHDNQQEPQGQGLRVVGQPLGKLWDVGVVSPPPLRNAESPEDPDKI